MADATLDRPAIAGGQKAKTVPYGSARRYGEDELKELREALEQNTLFYAAGKKVKQLEQEAAARIGRRFAVSTSSGTASIHAALTALGISPGDEVITSPVTDMGTLVGILYQGGVPVFADLDPHTYNLDPRSVAQRTTGKTKAILAVHLAGNACDIDALVELSRKSGAALVEDCAQAWGATYRGRWVGTYGAAGCFSLNEFKHISCGDGGLVLTDDEALAAKLRHATDKAYRRDATAAALRDPAFLAANYRMTELQGAVAVAQLRKIDTIVPKRRAWAAGLSEGLRGVKGITLPRITEGCEPAWWFYMMRVTPELKADATTFATALKAEGIPVQAHYIGRCVYEYPIFTNHSAFDHGEHPYVNRDYGKGLCPQAEAILDTCVMMKINEAYTEQDLRETIHGIRRVAGWYAAS